jgi:PKD repeat protein
MVHAWNGADPAGQDDGPTTHYELATRYAVGADITITALRVWHPATSFAVAGRTGRIWTTAGVQLETADLDDSLPSGWTEYPLQAPLEVLNGTTIDVSYGTTQFYGAVAGGFPAASADGLVTATAGRFVLTTGIFPTTGSANFFGIDIVYTEGVAGNTAPEVTALSVAVEELDAVATATVTDNDLPGVTYVWHWGDGAETATSAPTDEHTYAAAGLYAVLVVATDAGGLRDTRAVPVIVPGAPDGLDLEAAATELAERLATIADLAVDVFGPQSKRVHPDHAIVTLPGEPINYHGTYDAGGAMTEATLQIVVLVGQVHSVSAYHRLAQYASATGPRSIKVCVESGVYVHSSDPIVTVGAFDTWTFTGDTYLAVIFDVHLAG